MPRCASGLPPGLQIVRRMTSPSINSITQVGDSLMAIPPLSRADRSSRCPPLAANGRLVLDAAEFTRNPRSPDSFMVFRCQAAFAASLAHAPEKFRRAGDGIVALDGTAGIVLGESFRSK